MGAIGDNQASFLGAVEDVYDTVLINVGTGSQISFVSRNYVEGDGTIELRPCMKDGYLLAGSSLCGGRAYALLEQFYREVTGNRQESCYETMYRDAETFLQEQGMEQAWKVRTTFSGTRKDPGQTGEISGITVKNFHPGAMTVGVIRGILEELYQQYESMCRLTGRRAGRLAGSGNGLRQNPLMQKMAEELFQLKLEIPRYREEAACGAAFCAGKLL
nr:FGGY-family carbohydrate kinase [Suipraeoptans intestinalis]